MFRNNSAPISIHWRFWTAWNLSIEGFWGSNIIDYIIDCWVGVPYKNKRSDSDDLAAHRISSKLWKIWSGSRRINYNYVFQ